MIRDMYNYNNINICLYYYNTHGDKRTISEQYQGMDKDRQ